MGPDDTTFVSRALGWLAMRPIRLAYRLVWLSARLGSATGRDVYQAMWDANLDLPVLNALGAKP